MLWVYEVSWICWKKYRKCSNYIFIQPWPSCFSVPPRPVKYLNSLGLGFSKRNVIQLIHIVIMCNVEPICWFCNKTKWMPMFHILGILLGHLCRSGHNTLQLWHHVVSFVTGVCTRAVREVQQQLGYLGLVLEVATALLPSLLLWSCHKLRYWFWHTPSSQLWSPRTWQSRC